MPPPPPTKTTIIMSATADGELCPHAIKTELCRTLNKQKMIGKRGRGYTISKGGLEKQNNNIEQQ